MLSTFATLVRCSLLYQSYGFQRALHLYYILDVDQRLVQFVYC